MSLPRKLFALALPGAATVALGQDFYSWSPSQFETPAALRQLEYNQAAAALTPGSPTFRAPASFFSWGQVKLRPHLTARAVYNSGLLAAPGAVATETYTETVSPGFLFQLGERWVLDYTPSFNFYSSDRYQNNVNHNVAFRGGTRYNDWGFNVAQTYSRTSDPLIETAAQTDQEMFNTSLGASHYFNSKLQFEASLSQSIRLTEAFSNSRNWSTQESFNYQVASTVSVGLAFGGGYDDVEASSDMANEQLSARLNVRVLEKLSLGLSGGGEVRQIIGVDSDPLINPIYNASINYQPFDYTTLTLVGARSISASIFAGQITESSSISLAMHQRLLEKFNLTLSGAYRNTAFILSNAALATNRTDDSWSGLARLGYPFGRASLSVFYQFTSNKSSDAAFAFNNTQIGLEFSYQF